MSDRQQLVDEIARLAMQHRVRIAAAESLTSGAIASSLGAGHDASQWLGGAIVAYQSSVKFRLLDVPEGPVVSGACAEQMALGARGLFDADLAVSATGVGGPDPSEGKPPGTVFVSVSASSKAVTQALRLGGGPGDVVAATVDHALELVLEALRAFERPGKNGSPQA